MWDVTQTSWPLATVCAAVAVVFVVLWANGGRPWQLVAAIVAVGLGLGCYVIDANVVTDEEIVADHVIGLAHAYRDERVEETLAYFPPEDLFLRALVTKAFDTVDVTDDLRITDMQVEIDDDGTATAEFRANATVLFNGANVGYQPSKWRLVWKRIDEEWKVTAITRMNPIDGKAIAPLSGTGR